LEDDEKVMDAFAAIAKRLIEGVCIDLLYERACRHAWQQAPSFAENRSFL